VLLLPGHGEGGQGEGPVVEGQLEGDVDGVEEYLLADELNLQVLVVKVPRDLPYLAHGVIHEAPALASVMQSQSCEYRKGLQALLLEERASSPPRTTPGLTHLGASRSRR
jgi:hypothetical protein